MKIGIVGCGQVGSASAYACVLRGIGTEIVMVDRSYDLALAQAEDILHATPFSNSLRVSHGDYSDLENAGIVMISAGVAQKDGETRLDLLKRNAEVFYDIIPQILKYAPDTILLIASNPVDVMTHISAKIAATHKKTGKKAQSAAKVIGSGTILDTARYRALLGQHLGVSSQSVHAYVLGEHGDSEVLHWSGANIGNLALSNFAAQVKCSITEDVKQRIDDGVRNAAYRIIKGKGATWYGIGAGMATIAKAIISDEHCVLTCSSPVSSGIEGVQDVSLSLPRIINANGICETLYPELNADEHQGLQHSAEILADTIQKII